MSELLFDIAKAYIHEAACRQLAWLLSSATASADEERWPSFLTGSSAFSNFKAFPKRMLLGDGLMALLRRTTNGPLERRISRGSFITGVEHRYINNDSASDSFFEDSLVLRKKSRLAVRGRNEASLAHITCLVSTLAASAPLLVGALVSDTAGIRYQSVLLRTSCVAYHKLMRISMKRR